MQENLTLGKQEELLQKFLERLSNFSEGDTGFYVTTFHLLISD